MSKADQHILQNLDVIRQLACFSARQAVHRSELARQAAEERARVALEKLAASHQQWRNGLEGAFPDPALLGAITAEIARQSEQHEKQLKQAKQASAQSEKCSERLVEAEADRSLSQRQLRDCRRHSGRAADAAFALEVEELFAARRAL